MRFFFNVKRTWIWVAAQRDDEGRVVVNEVDWVGWCLGSYDYEQNAFVMILKLDEIEMKNLEMKRRWLG